MSRTNLFLVLLLLFNLCPLLAQKTFTLKGICKGEDLWIQNPFLVGEDRFCIVHVRINGQTLVREPKLSALRIDLQHFSLYQPLKLVITHDPNCQPLVLNPEALSEKPAFRFLSVAIHGDSLIWQVRDEDKQGKYVVERLLQEDEWETLQTVPVERKGMERSYSIFPEQFQGYNKFRVQYHASDKKVLSAEVENFHKGSEGIDFEPYLVKDKITLSESSYFEILNAKEEVILKGTTKVIPLRKLKPGDYYIVLQGELLPFVKK